MKWYMVTKTIGGRKYLYWQRTERRGRSVQTFNRYICPADSRQAAFAHAIKKPEVIAPREQWRDQEVYRYVKEWGQYEYANPEDAARYARDLEHGEGGKWNAVQLSSGFWRAHREPDKPSYLNFCCRCEKADDNLDWQRHCVSCAGGAHFVRIKE